MKLKNIHNQYNAFEDKPVAYFCAEYALFDHDPLYAGGLGILAGDYINEMVSQNFPAIAFGLFYHKNDEHGTEPSSERKTPPELGLTLVKKSDGSVLKLPIKIDKRTIYIQAWQWKKNKVNLYLLDTQLEENSSDDWKICDELYVEDRYLRLEQEIILGIGGMKVLKALNIHPSVYHLNEGHSAFMLYELIKQEMKNRKIEFNEACKYAKRQVVFTNHTLVSAGQEMFDIAIMKTIFPEEFINLGLNSENGMFSMTNLALNMSSKVNAVSQLHGKTANELWKNYQIESITNGINLDRWDSLKFYSHKEKKRELIKLIEEKSHVSFDENTLLLGWARRFVEYKRPLAILGDIERLKKLANITNRKIQIVFSSSLNETYIEKNDFLKKIDDLMNNELKGMLAFIPSYDMRISKLMVSGCDIWLNTPIVGREACGTSGMKACLNGVLPLTTKDGWIDEIDISALGWEVTNSEKEDDITENLLTLLENTIVPEYYDNPNRWKERMNSARKLIMDKFSTKRMLDEYIQKLYIPISLSSYP